MAVTSGDQVDLEVWARYTGTIGTNSAITQANVVTAVAATFGGISGGTTEQQSIYNLFNANASYIFVGNTGSDVIPRAYLNYILFDQDLNYITSGYDRVSTAAGSAHEKLFFPTLNINEGGYLYVYVSNESNANFDAIVFSGTCLERPCPENTLAPKRANPVNHLSAKALSKKNQPRCRSLHRRTSAPTP